MKNNAFPRRKLERVKKLKRKKFHPLLHHVHKRHHVSYRTLYYIKSFHHDRHVWHAILKQSLGIVLLASIISTFGGVWLQSLEAKITVLIPLLVMIPALNGMVGNFGTIMSSKFSAYLFTGRVKGKWWKCFKVQELIFSVVILAITCALYISVMSCVIAGINGFAIDAIFLFKLISISLFCTVMLIGLIIVISFAGGYIIFKKGDDPNNFLIPITTAVADMGNLTIFAYAVVAMF